MTRFATRFLSVAVPLAASLLAYADGPGLSLRIKDEAAPAGTIVQIKVDVTEPKPISSGRGKIKTTAFAAARFGVTGLSSVSGQSVQNSRVESIALLSAGQDTYGVAMVDGDEIVFNVVSPASDFGTMADHPILVIATRVPASNGSTYSVTLDPSGFRDPSGAEYAYEIKSGVLAASSSAITISDVSPGSAVVPAGGVVHITGANFTPATRIDLDEVDVAAQNFINGSRIDVVLAQSARMHGLRIRARNDGKSGDSRSEGESRSECEYFSYERTEAVGRSNDAVFSTTIPLFAPLAYTDATIRFPNRASRKRRAVGPSGPGSSNQARSGFALQNLEKSTASASIELLDAGGHPYAMNTVTVGPDQHFVREVQEVFGIVAPPSAIRIRSSVPLHVLGLTTDPTTGGAAALPPL